MDENTFNGLVHTIDSIVKDHVMHWTIHMVSPRLEYVERKVSEVEKKSDNATISNASGKRLQECIDSHTANFNYDFDHLGLEAFQDRKLPFANVGLVVENLSLGYADVDNLYSYAEKYQRHLEMRLFSKGLKDYKNRVLETLKNRRRNESALWGVRWLVGTAVTLVISSAFTEINPIAMYGAPPTVGLLIGTLVYTSRSMKISHFCEDVKGTEEYEKTIKRELRESLVGS